MRKEGDIRSSSKIDFTRKIKSFHLTNSCRGHWTMSVNIILVDTKGHIEKRYAHANAQSQCLHHNHSSHSLTGRMLCNTDIF